MATHSSIFAWRIARTEAPSRLWSMGLQTVGQRSQTMKHASMHSFSSVLPPSILISLLAPQHLLVPTYYQHIPLAFSIVFSSTPFIALLWLSALPASHTHQTSPVLQPSQVVSCSYPKTKQRSTETLLRIAVWGRILWPSLTNIVSWIHTCMFTVANGQNICTRFIFFLSPLPLSLIILASILVFFSKFLC